MAMPELPATRLAENPRVGAAGVAKLARSRVGVIGDGTLGGQVIPHLAQLGVGLVIVDPQRVGPENVGTQFVSSADVGRNKVDVRAAQARALGANSVEAHAARLEALGFGALAHCDLIIGALDAVRPRLLLNTRCLRLGLPLVDLALDGTGKRLYGTVAVFDARKPDDACLACRYDARALASIAREGLPQGCPSWRRAPELASAPTLQTSGFAGIVAGYAVVAALHLLLEGGAGVVGAQLIVDADTPERTRRVALARSAHCPFHAPQLLPLRRAVGETVGELLEQATAELELEPDRLELHERSLVRGLRCPHCGVERDVVRCADSIADAELRCSCGAELAPLALDGALASAEARAISHRRWSDLGIPRAEVISVCAEDRIAHYLANVERQELA